MQLDIPADLDLTEREPEPDDFNLGVEIAKSLTLSAVQTAGVVGGLVVVAFAWDAATKLRKRYGKKRPVLYLVTDLPKTAEN